MEKVQWTSSFMVRENSPALETVYTDLVDLTLAEGCQDDWRLTNEVGGAGKEESLKSNCFVPKKPKQ